MSRQVLDGKLITVNQPNLRSDLAMKELGRV
jgi:hypothetical protein